MFLLSEIRHCKVLDLIKMTGKASLNIQTDNYGTITWNEAKSKHTTWQFRLQLGFEYDCTFLEIFPEHSTLLYDVAKYEYFVSDPLLQ